ncbi:CHAT domain-containing protein [Nocardia sp. NPDC051832]|uniref:CHAT domain-containing protein n=1 Tax=Nocardia sp. NPDC051832 TaxID=3155673 RepID=UPI003423703A
MSPDDDPHAQIIEQTIQDLTAAWHADPSDRIRAQLAIAYGQRVLGSREENIHQILVHTDSLDDLDDQDNELLLTARVLRGRAFRDLGDASGMGPMNLQVALHFFEDVVQQLDPGSVEWADVEVDIAKTLLRMNDVWTDAIDHLHSALLTYRQNRSAQGVGAAHELLGELHHRLAEQTRTAAPRSTALNHYSQALANTDRVTCPEQWARIQTAIGRLTLGAGPAAFEIAESHFLAARDATAGLSTSTARLDALTGLAHLHLAASRWDDAIAPIQEALEIATDGLRIARTVDGMRTAVIDISTMSRNLAFCYYKTGQLDLAAVTVESGNALLLASRLHWNTDNTDLPSTQQMRQLLRLSRKIRKLEARQYGGVSWIEDSDRLTSLRNRFDAVFAGADPEHQLAAGRALTVAQIAPTESATALVLPLVSPNGGAWFILTQGDQHVAAENVLDLPEFTTAAVDRWLIGDQNAPGWLAAMQHRYDAPNGPQRWRSTMVEVCEQVGATVFDALHSRLLELGATRVVLVPVGGLQFLPLHAAVVGTGPGQQFLIDDLTVEYTPSARVRTWAKRRREGLQLTGQALVAGVGRYQSHPPLHAVPDEVTLVAAALETTALLDEQASRKKILRQMRTATAIHLACHGAQWALGGALFRLEWSPPAVLHLHRLGLSFQDILLQDLRNARLVCLSACDTGLVDKGLPWDEFEGLVNVFLQAGAPAVVSSLWAVDDRSTALLMERFYRNLSAAADDPAAALRDAQLWLKTSTRASLASHYEQHIERGMHQFIEPYTQLLLGGAPDERPYSHPAHWAPFVFTGA